MDKYCADCIHESKWLSDNPCERCDPDEQNEWKPKEGNNGQQDED